MSMENAATDNSKQKGGLTTVAMRDTMGPEDTNQEKILAVIIIFHHWWQPVNNYMLTLWNYSLMAHLLNLAVGIMGCNGWEVENGKLVSYWKRRVLAYQNFFLKAMACGHHCSAPC